MRQKIGKNAKIDRNVYWPKATQAFKWFFSRFLSYFNGYGIFSNVLQVFEIWKSLYVYTFLPIPNAISVKRKKNHKANNKTLFEHFF